jgi:hypothetical protein
MSKAFMRTCAQCEQDIPHDQVTSWGKTSWIDKICKTNYNRQTERCKNNPNLKTWWKNLSREERVQWFLSNKAHYEPGGLKAFDNAGLVEEEVSDVVRNTDDLIVSYMTLEDWTIRQKQLGYCGDGGHEQQNEVAEKSFMAKVMDKKAMTKFKNGMWLVAVFSGGEVRIGKEHAHKFHQKRKKTINDAMDYETAGAMKKAATSTSSAFLATAMEAALEGIDDGAGREVNIPDGLARNPVVKVSNNDEFGEDIHRDVVMAMQRDAKMAVQEEMDDHVAEQARRIARGNSTGIRGRPFKLRSELLSDVSKMKRDRCTHISDAMLAVTAMMASAELEVEINLGKPLPDDLTLVLAQMKLDSARTTLQRWTKSARSSRRRLWTPSWARKTARSTRSRNASSTRPSLFLPSTSDWPTRPSMPSRQQPGRASRRRRGRRIGRRRFQQWCRSCWTLL